MRLRTLRDLTSISSLALLIWSLGTLSAAPALGDLTPPDQKKVNPMDAPESKNETAPPAHDGKFHKYTWGKEKDDETPAKPVKTTAENGTPKKKKAKTAAGKKPVDKDGNPPLLQITVPQTRTGGMPDSSQNEKRRNQLLLMTSSWQPHHYSSATNYAQTSDFEASGGMPEFGLGLVDNLGLIAAPDLDLLFSASYLQLKRSGIAQLPGGNAVEDQNMNFITVAAGLQNRFFIRSLPDKFHPFYGVDLSYSMGEAGSAAFDDVNDHFWGLQEKLGLSYGPASWQIMAGALAKQGLGNSILNGAGIFAGFSTEL